MNIYWATFILLFAFFAKSVWFFYYFTLYAFPLKVWRKKFDGKTSLIIPVYNESPERLKDTIKHCLKAKGVDEIIFVNDGSTNNTQEILQSYSGYKIVNLCSNVGKRKAQFEGVKVANPDSEVFVFMDSDTILMKKSIVMLTKPMRNKRIGGSTGCILVKNRNDNILTKCLSAMYWSASNIWREAPSSMGFIQVTNGQLACYRASIIREIMPAYIEQEFMGQSCTLSDDRYLTHHIQTDFKKRIVYVRNAVVHTYVPNTISGIYRMFLRWKRGSWRESILLLHHFWKKPVLACDVWANHIIQVGQTIIRVVMVLFFIFFTPYALLYYALVVLIISLLFGFHMIVKNAREIGYRLLYSLLNEILFSWSHIHALLTIRQQGKWVTR